MIKEKSKKARFGKEMSLDKIILSYLRTIGFSFLIAFLFTLLLSFHARNEMIKNLYTNVKEQQKFDEQLARQLVVQSDFAKDLRQKRYSVCMQVGMLYEAAKDYKNAQYAYEIALDKARPEVYAPYYRLAKVLIAQEKFKEAQDIIKSARDINNKHLVKFKTRSYIEMGDKYYSIGKFLSAAKSYEKSKYYYDKFKNRDEIVEKAIAERIVNSYVQTADIMVKNGLNSDAVRFLAKAEKLAPKNFLIRYKLAIIYSDLDAEKSVKYFERLMEECPQEIDYGVYAKALMKAANIADWQGNNIQAKYYRYKIHSLDLFVDNKVIYKNDVEIYLDSFTVRKMWLKYHLRGMYRIKNVSHTDITNLSAEFVLKRKDNGKILESVNTKVVTKNNPLYSNGGVTEAIMVNLGKNIFTKRELDQYIIEIYLYKDEKYKTLITTMNVPKKSING